MWRKKTSKKKIYFTVQTSSGKGKLPDCICYKICLSLFAEHNFSPHPLSSLLLHTCQFKPLEKYKYNEGRMIVIAPMSPSGYCFPSSLRFCVSKTDYMYLVIYMSEFGYVKHFRPIYITHHEKVVFRRGAWRQAQ